MSVFGWILLRMRNVSDKSCRENQNTHFMFSNILLENRAVYEIMLKNMVEPGRPQMTIWLSVACWISKATRTQAHARIPTPTPTHTHTHTRTHTHTHTRPHTRMHARTHHHPHPPPPTPPHPHPHTHARTHIPPPHTHTHARTHTQYLLLFHGNGVLNAPQCYVVRALPVLLVF
jgi:hypothetical protein